MGIEASVLLVFIDGVSIDVVAFVVAFPFSRCCKRSLAERGAVGCGGASGGFVGKSAEDSNDDAFVTSIGLTIALMLMPLSSWSACSP